MQRYETHNRDRTMVQEQGEKKSIESEFYFGIDRKYFEKTNIAVSGK